MKRYLLSFVAACLCSASMWAVPASPVPFEYRKADGTTVMARMYGDEFHSYIMSLDGELLEGSMEPQAMEEASFMRRNVRRMPQAIGNSPIPTKGSPRSLVLLVSFADLEMGETLQDFRDLLNKSGYDFHGATGSCRDYFIASSDSLFSPQFDCFGPYKLSRKMEYYGANEGSSNSAHASQMVTEACELAHTDGVNFKDYDLNNDGVLDNVFIFFAGHNEAEGAGAQTIWPHQSDVSHMNVRIDGILLASYACTSEYKGVDGKDRCGVGTFCHEFGHVIGLPDFYDTDYNYYSVGNWDIMCNGSYNNNGNTPPTYSAYERFYEGWLTPKQLELPGQYVLTDIPFHKESFLIAASTHNLSGTRPDPNEFFMLDYRSGENGWDQYLPGQGMIVWHIDYNAAAWNSNTPNNGPTLMRMHMEEANGITWKKRSNSNKGKATDVYPGPDNVTVFHPVLHNGSQLEQPIFNIMQTGNTISFIYISNEGSTLRANKDLIEITTSMSDKKKVVDWQPESFELLGSGLDPEQAVTLTPGANTFSLCASDTMPDIDSDEWQSTLSLYPTADSTIQQLIWVNFHPTKKNCNATKTTIAVSAATASLSIPLIGHSPRPVYVQTPTDVKSKQVTPYSFDATWSTVSDAEAYYVTVYQIEEGTTEFLQGFEDFNDADKVRDMGWQSNTNLITTSAKAEGSRSLYFKNYGDEITSESYPSPVTGLSFWYNAFTASVDTIGVLEIEAFNGEEWLMEDRLVIVQSDKRVTAKYTFEPEQNYRAFRLTWMDNGGSGIAFDAFVATTSEKINYIHKGRELLFDPQEGKTQSNAITGLNPNNTYYYQVQCSDLDKGCEEHLTELSEPVKVTTLNGQPLDGKQLTFAVDSLNYNPAERAIYIMDPQEGDYLHFYNPAGRLVHSIALIPGVCVYPVEHKYFEHGYTYMAQHAVNGKLGRKNKWVKFIF